jgi:hypothetical protein
MPEILCAGAFSCMLGHRGLRETTNDPMNTRSKTWSGAVARSGYPTLGGAEILLPPERAERKP